MPVMILSSVVLPTPLRPVTDVAVPGTDLQIEVSQHLSSGLAADPTIATPR